MEKSVLDQNGTPTLHQAMLVDEPTNDIIGINNFTNKDDVSLKRQEARKMASHLIDCITKLVPIEEFADKFDILHEPKPLSTHNLYLKWSIINNESLLREGSDSLVKRNHLYPSVSKQLDQVCALEHRITTAREEDLEDILEQLHHVGVQLNLSVSRLRQRFSDYAYTSSFCKPIVENMVHKIKHRDYRDEARMYYKSICDEAGQINFQAMIQPDFKVWCDDTSRSISLMMNIIKKRMVVEKLVIKDRNRSRFTKIVVTSYIFILLSLISWLVYYFGGKNLDRLELPLIRIPTAVLLWSLIGSFAAMIYRLNKQPIYEFENAFKWMITRPIQGVILGATMYVIIKGGLFLLTGETHVSSLEEVPAASSTTTVVPADEVKLVLCFLVGFSDRFADFVFNTLVKRYTGEEEAKADGKDEMSTGK